MTNEKSQLLWLGHTGGDGLVPRPRDLAGFSVTLRLSESSVFSWLGLCMSTRNAQNVYSIGVDMWAVGCVFAEMATGGVVL